MPSMPSRAEEVYTQLRNVSAIKALINETEDAHLDCKEWPGDDDGQKMLAKAACGLTNAEGGVLVIGMKAKSSHQKDEPDIISATAPVKNTALVKSKCLNLIGSLVEPGIVGISAREIKESKGSKSGFVVIFVPASDGTPRRSRKDWKFYQRIGSGTFPMEYRQIQDMFGKRPHPRLSVILERVSIGTDGYSMVPLKRIFRLGLKNEGRGVARFPCVKFSKKHRLSPALAGLDGNTREALPQRASEYPWVIYQGGIDSVIYPDETFMITKLVQEGLRRGEVGTELRNGRPVQGSRPSVLWEFGPIAFSCEISCEEIRTIEGTASFDAEEHREPI